MPGRTLPPQRHSSWVRHTRSSCALAASDRPGPAIRCQPRPAPPESQTPLQHLLMAIHLVVAFGVFQNLE
jgi:hypothetical protein